MAFHQDKTSMGGPDARFPLTDWTRIDNPAMRDAIMAELCQKYWKPLYSFLRYKGFSNEKAKDLVQGFFTDKILGREFLQKAERTKGRFRNFLLVAIRNYAINAQKKDSRAAKLNDNPRKRHQCADPEAEFNRVWAEQTLQKVLTDLEIECKEKGKDTHWQAFRDWLLEPDIDSRPAQMADICKKYAISDASKAYNMIANVKKRFRAILREQLRTQVSSDEDVDKEIMDFINIFSRNTARY